MMPPPWLAYQLANGIDPNPEPPLSYAEFLELENINEADELALRETLKNYADSVAGREQMIAPAAPWAWNQRCDISDTSRCYCPVGHTGRHNCNSEYCLDCAAGEAEPSVEEVEELVG